MTDANNKLNGRFSEEGGTGSSPIHKLDLEDLKSQYLGAKTDILNMYIDDYKKIKKKNYNVALRSRYIFIIYMVKYWGGAMYCDVSINNIFLKALHAFFKALHDIPDYFIFVVVVLFFFDFIKDYLFSNLLKALASKIDPK